jgi:hypothetical protein
MIERILPTHRIADAVRAVTSAGIAGPLPVGQGEAGIELVRRS